MDNTIDLGGIKPSKSLLYALNIGYEPIQKPPNNQSQILFKECESIITSVSTGFEPTEKPPVKPKPDIQCRLPQEKNPDSVIESVETGFGCDNTLVKPCPKPTYKTHLCKENYLGEFKSESEKQLARNNLGVYSNKEIDKIIEDIINTNDANYITRIEVQQIVADLDFVDSKLKSYADYQIPNNLFKL